MNRFYADPSKLHDAQPPVGGDVGGSTVQIVVNGNQVQLLVRPGAGFMGKLQIDVTVSDGAQTIPETFTVHVVTLTVNCDVCQFDGTYSGGYSGTAVVPGYGTLPVSGGVSFTVAGGRSSSRRPAPVTDRYRRPAPQTSALLAEGEFFKELPTLSVAGLMLHQAPLTEAGRPHSSSTEPVGLPPAGGTRDATVCWLLVETSKPRTQ